MTSPRLPAFLADLRAVLEAKRGRKADLARYLNAHPPQLSDWLSGLHAPSAETLLSMQAWLKTLPNPKSKRQSDS